VKTRFRIESKSSLALAALLSVPLYFAALLASSLALDAPSGSGLHQGPSTTATELKVWAAALLAPAALFAIGIAALPLRRFGLFVSAGGAIAICLLLPRISKHWIPGHVRRFPLGMDFIPDRSPSNLSSRGEWEQAAQHTIASISHFTLIIAVGAIVVGVLLELRRRRGAASVLSPPPPAIFTGEAETVPIVESERADSDR
jgi:hypothetical protein